MITTCCLLATLLLALCSSNPAIAQTPPPQTQLPRDIEQTIDLPLPGKEPLAAPSTVVVTATASSQRVRYVSIGEVYHSRLQVFSSDGRQVFDSDFRLGNLIDWQLTDQQGQPLSSGSYLFLVTVRDFSSRLTQKYGMAILEQEQVYLEQTMLDVLSQAQSTALAANRLTETLSPVDRLGAAGPGRNSTTTATRTGESTATGTEPSNTTEDPKAAAGGGENISGTGTTNKVAKWTDGPGGVLGDSAISEVSGLTVFGQPLPLFPTAPSYHVVEIVAPGAKSPLVLAGGSGVMEFWKDLGGGTGAINRAVGFGMAKPGTVATDDMVFSTFTGGAGAAGWAERLRVTNNGNVGIGTTNPTGGQLDVVGAINTSTQYNLGGLKVLNVPGLNNTYAGVGAGAAHTAGQNNAFFGTNAGLSNTSGFRNDFFGSGTGAANTTGSANSFFGDFAGTFSTTGIGNSFFGAGSGLFSVNGISNTFIGEAAGQSDVTGFRNTALGSAANFGSDNLTNATAIGARAYVTQNNSLVLGSMSGQNGSSEDTDVGIGTTAPQARLHVATGSILVSSNASGAVQIGGRYRDNSIIGWGTIGAGGAILHGFGVTSVTNDSTGVYTVTLAVTTSDNPNLVPVANAEVGAQPTSAADARLVTIDQIGLTQFKVYITTGAFAAVNNKFTFIVTGR